MPFRFRTTPVGHAPGLHGFGAGFRYGLLCLLRGTQVASMAPLSRLSPETVRIALEVLPSRFATQRTLGHVMCSRQAMVAVGEHHLSVDKTQLEPDSGLTRDEARLFRGPNS